ncbi:hypothetical protein BDP55DRAFT_631962 [Colletotrichum godetiae]|uniref:Uncharacterized protein n=1 Tax=Colletotrichum godetiae TaxID=1209918 RepID=A0AAJ0AM50_9PEZI|nr:uncharacterized protein BDP55DRAFT_631962 [Colletotrichum godetiae]KAK1675779.1 hypothetical protein BDP55DRAFT_631962 [Colletotrichum godetiae]
MAVAAWHKEAPKSVQATVELLFVISTTVSPRILGPKTSTPARQQRRLSNSRSKDVTWVLLSREAQRLQEQREEKKNPPAGREVVACKLRDVGLPACLAKKTRTSDSLTRALPNYELPSGSLGRIFCLLVSATASAVIFKVQYLEYPDTKDSRNRAALRPWSARNASVRASNCGLASIMSWLIDGSSRSRSPEMA